MRGNGEGSNAGKKGGTKEVGREKEKRERSGGEKDG